MNSFLVNSDAISDLGLNREENKAFEASKYNNLAVQQTLKFILWNF